MARKVTQKLAPKTKVASEKKNKPSVESEKRRMAEIIRILKREYGEVRCYLDYQTPYQLMVATILSAQCTDERVNLTTPALFAKYPDAASMAKAPLSAIEKLVQSTGFYRMKAKSISETSKRLVKEYGGEVPRTMEELVDLRGVGRKTANVILGNAYGIPGFVVDTHVGRITRRMGFTRETDAVKVEHEVREFVPMEDWSMFSLWLIAHGRAVCTARRAKCDECLIARFCPKTGV